LAAGEDLALPDDVHKLVKRCLAGEQAGMVELVERFRRQVFGLCLRMLSHQQDAEDATQESFVRALRSLRNFDPEREFLPWLLAIAGNRCRTMLSARARRPATTPLVDHVPDGAVELAGANNLAEEVKLALSTLRAEYRQAFLLFHEQELSYAEIGIVMSCPLGTVKTWVHRARRELIERLSQRGVIEEARHAVRRV
jgi:RNA polymerase sigma-70 factor (ECF subfamily)